MIRVGVIGFGYWGPNLVRNMVETDGIEVVACADLREDRLDVARRRYPGVKMTRSAMELIEDDGIDAIVVATAVGHHFALASAALEHGKHVLVEKPMARTVGQAEKLIETANRSGLVLLVDHTFVYTGAVRKMAEVLHELGDLFYFDSTRVNLGLVQPDIDVIWDLAPHDLSILMHLVDVEPTHVSASGVDHIGNGHADIAYLTLFFPGDFIAHFHVNWLSPVKVRQILVGGSRKMLVYDDMEPSEKVRVYDSGVEMTEREGAYERRVEYRTGDMWAPKISLREALAVECAHFVDCVANGATPVSGGDEGLRVVRVLEAASASLVADGERIAL